jgi:hypothetical protein
MMMDLRYLVGSIAANFNMARSYLLSSPSFPFSSSIFIFT